LPRRTAGTGGRGACLFQDLPPVQDVQRSYAQSLSLPAAAFCRAGGEGDALNDRVDVLVPTCNRPWALAMTLTSLAAQTVREMRICISDQSDRPDVLEQPELMAVRRLLNATGRTVEAWRHLPCLGMAEQRAFLLSRVE